MLFNSYVKIFIYYYVIYVREYLMPWEKNVFKEHA